MRTLIRIAVTLALSIATIVLCSALCAFQYAGVPFTATSGSVSGGWQLLQTEEGGVASNSGSFQIQDACTSSPTSSCTVQLLPTTAGSVRVIGLVTDTNNNLTITSAYDCADSSGCNSGNALDTFTLCTAGACHIHTTNDNIDAAYVVNGAANATYATFNISGTPSTNYYFISYMEEMPPTCGGSPCTTFFDTNAAFGVSSGCSRGCTIGSSSMTLTATDGILGIIDTSNPVGSFVAPYRTESTGNVYGIDATSAPSFQVQTAGWLTLSNLAFNSSGGSYSPPTKVFSTVDTANSVSMGNYDFALICTPTCTLTLPNSSTTGSGHLLFLSVGASDATLSSVTGGGTWVVPSGADTCQNTSATANWSSCGYVLSSSSGTNSFTITMSTDSNAYVHYYEIARTSGSFVLDAQNSTYNPSGTNPFNGQNLTLGGIVDVCFQQLQWADGSGGLNATSLYEYAIKGYPWAGGQNEMGAGGTPIKGGVHSMLLNARNNTPPTLLLSGTPTTTTVSAVCFQ